MKSSNEQVPATRAIPFGPGLEAQLRPVAHASGRGFVGIDFRLHRDVRGTGEFSVTQAGFRLPTETLRVIAGHLLEIAEELGV